jgi:hypothetical protein
MHHNNIDRFYEQYLAMHPDSHDEFIRQQDRLGRRRQVVTQAGCIYIYAL